MLYTHNSKARTASKSDTKDVYACSIKSGHTAFSSPAQLMSSAARKVDKKVANLLLKVAQKVATLKNHF